MQKLQNWRIWAVYALAIPVTLATAAMPLTRQNTESKKAEQVVETTPSPDSAEPPSTPAPSPSPTAEPTPTPKPATKPRKAVVNTAGVEQWREVVSRYDWPVEEALTIMKCESGGNESRINNNPRTGDYSVGLFQVNLIGKMRQTRPPETWLLVGENNIAHAYKMYSGMGRRFGTTGGWYNCAKKFGIH